jgi:hypothetical protein
MNNKNSKRQNFCYAKQGCLSTEEFISCLVVDYILIQRGQIPFACALAYLLLNSANNRIYKQNLLNKKNCLSKGGEVIMAKAVKKNTYEKNFKQGSTQYFDEPDLPMDECDSHKVRSKCNKAVKDNTYENNSKYGSTQYFDESSLLMDEGDSYKDHSKCNNVVNGNICQNDFKYGSTYYFDKSGLPMDEGDSHRVHSKCNGIIETSCSIQLPRGFRLTDALPRMCFNLAGLSCVKNPIVQKLSLPVCGCEHPKKCEVVAGYEIRAVGEVNFSASVPICPIRGFCIKTRSYICCSSTVPVNEIISHTCSAKPCAENVPCVDWTYCYFCATLVEEDCVSMIRVKIGIALEYTDECECDEE